MDDHTLLSMELVDPTSLGKIDNLFACGVGDYVSLPQIVVVGDQSSGKSSVLQGLTKLPFPRDSDLCTRFVTQITFRRAQSSRVSISILPAKTSNSEHVAKVQAWSKNIPKLDAKTFSDIMDEVHEVMGISRKNSTESQGTFSEDILKLDVIGPRQEHFSVIDVPGIFRKDTKGVTTREDRRMVRSMVQHYVENPRSVILAVAPANVDVTTQSILDIAEEADKEGTRTLGVLTKPDLVDKGAEGSLVEIIEGKKHCLGLGWYILRNPGQSQLSDHELDRDREELNFFNSTSPWKTLDRARVGIASLKLRLRKILADQIRREFPHVKNEIYKLLSSRRQGMEKLGAKRSTTDEQRSYLLDISMHFQEVATSALNNKYVGNDWFEKHKALKFATRLVNRNDEFRETMELLGCMREFVNLKSVEYDREAPIDGLGQPKKENDVEVIERCVRTTEEHPDLVDLSFPAQMIRRTLPDPGIMVWLKTVYEDFRGFELGTFDPSILAITMNQQSNSWESIAMGYISDVITFAHTFIEQLMTLVCADGRTRNGLMSMLMDELLSRYKKASDHVRFLLKVERSGTPYTVNSEFSWSLEQSYERTQAEISEMSNSEYNVQKLHDILSAYYEIAWQRFADNICLQAVDYHFVSNAETPLKLFSPKFVYGLTDEQLEDIAGEDTAIKERRDVLTREIEKLEAGRRILL